MGAVVERQRRSSGAYVRPVWPMRAATLPRRDAPLRGRSCPVAYYGTPSLLGLVARHGALVVRAREQSEHAN